MQHNLVTSGRTEGISMKLWWGPSCSISRSFFSRGWWAWRRLLRAAGWFLMSCPVWSQQLDSLILVGLFQLMMGYSTLAEHKYLIPAAWELMEVDFFRSCAAVEWGATGANWNAGSSVLTQGRTSLLLKWWSPGTGQRGCGVSPGDFQSPPGCFPMRPTVVNPLKQEIGPHDLLRSLPIPQFCDSVKMQYLVKPLVLCCLLERAFLWGR